MIQFAPTDIPMPAVAPPAEPATFPPQVAALLDAIELAHDRAMRQAERIAELEAKLAAAPAGAPVEDLESEIGQGLGLDPVRSYLVRALDSVVVADIGIAFEHCRDPLSARIANLIAPNLARELPRMVRGLLAGRLHLITEEQRSNDELVETTRKARELVSRLVDVRGALEDAQHWHENQDKALSKSGRRDGDCQWRRAQHYEQREAIQAARDASAGEIDGFFIVTDTPGGGDQVEAPGS